AFANPLFLRLRGGLLGAGLAALGGLRLLGFRLFRFRFLGLRLGGLGLGFRFRRGARRRLGRADALLPGDGLEPRDVAPNHAHARSILELAGGALEAQVELLLLELDHFVVDLVEGHRPYVCCFHGRLLGDAFDETGLDRQLGGGERERFLGDRHRYAVDFEQNAARLDAGHPQFGRALAFAHAHFDRLLRHRHVRIDANPHPAGALHEAGERAARALDLARSDAVRLERLQAVLAERQLGPRGRGAVDAALELLAELAADRLQHDLALVPLRPRCRAADGPARLRPSSCPAPSDRARGSRL